MRSPHLLILAAVLATAGAVPAHDDRHVAAGSIRLSLSTRANCTQCARSIVVVGGERLGITSDGLGVVLDCIHVEHADGIHRLAARAVNGGGQLAFALLIEDRPEGDRGSWDFVPVALERCGMERLASHAARGDVTVVDAP